MSFRIVFGHDISEASFGAQGTYQFNRSLGTGPAPPASKPTLPDLVSFLRASAIITVELSKCGKDGLLESVIIHYLFRIFDLCINSITDTLDHAFWIRMADSASIISIALFV